MEPESKFDHYKQFMTISKDLKQLVQERSKLLGSSEQSHTQKQLQQNSMKIYFSMMKAKQIYRASEELIAQESKGIALEKSKLETLTNYNEGLLYQRANIKRQIQNCENVQVDTIASLIPSIKDHFETLGKTNAIDRLQELDPVITSEMNFELEKRKKLKVELETVEKTKVQEQQSLSSVQQNYSELMAYAINLEEDLRLSYEKYSGQKIVSIEEAQLIKEMPASLKIIFNKFLIMTQETQNPAQSQIKIEALEFEDNYKPATKGILHRGYVRVRYTPKTGNLESSEIIIDFGYVVLGGEVILRISEDVEGAYKVKDLLFEIYGKEKETSPNIFNSVKPKSLEETIQLEFIKVPWISRLTSKSQSIRPDVIFERLEKLVDSKFDLKRQIEILNSSNGKFSYKGKDHSISSFEEIDETLALQYGELKTSFRSHNSKNQTQIEVPHLETNEQRKSKQFTQMLQHMARIQTLSSKDQSILRNALTIDQINLIRGIPTLSVRNINFGDHITKNAEITYYKFELVNSSKKQFIVLLQVFIQDGIMDLKIDLVIKSNQIKRKKYPKDYSEFLKKVDRSKIFKYTKSQFLITRATRNIERKIREAIDNLSKKSKKHLLFEKIVLLKNLLETEPFK